MSNSKNSYYTISSKDLFNDAEPYLYGEPYPNTGKYLPLPWGKDTEEFTTDDLKIQMPEYNGYSNIKYIDGFKINGNPLAYIEKGTFPIISEKTLINSFDTPKEAEDEGSELYLVVNYDFNPTTEAYSIREILWDITKLPTESWDDINRITLPKTDFNKLGHGLDGEFPKRLGFILVGAGGGAGGITQYDPNKNGKTNDQYSCPGSGGGGGETVWGVLNLEAPKTYSIKNSSGDEFYNFFGKATTTPTVRKNNKLLPCKIKSLTFKIELGLGGYCGAHGDWDAATHNKPQSGKKGSNGNDSKISVSASFYLPIDVEKNEDGQDIVKYEEDDIQYTNFSLEEGKTDVYTPVAKACGGFGGNPGSWTYDVSGGSGGAYNEDIGSDTGSCVICGRQRGGDGASFINGQECANKDLNFDIYCSGAIPVKSDHFLKVTHSRVVGGGSSSGKDNTQTVDSPGGHSFGNGATKTSAATYGGGGDCSMTTDSRSGADGYFAIYY